MKKADWLIAAGFLAMGTVCLFLSASSFHGMPMRRMGMGRLPWGRACLAAMIVAGIVGLAYWIWISTQNKKNGS